MPGTLQPPIRLPRGYRERKLVEPPICARNGCRNAPAEDSDLCPGCRERARAANRAWAAARRAKRKRARRCRDCGRPARRARCQACRIVVGQAPKRGVDSRVETTPRTRKHADGRTRFHGQMRRGRQTNASLDAQDLADALKYVERGRAGLAYAASPEVQALPRIQREAAQRAALAQIALAVRLLEQPLERHHYDEDLARAAPRPKG